MTIDFNPVNPTQLQIQGRQQNSNEKLEPELDHARHETNKGNQQTDDGVQLTQRTQQLKALEESIAKLPVIDTDKVAEIKAQLADGSYKIDVETIADKFIDLEAEISKIGK